MLFVVKDRLEVLNQNIDFERGVELLRRGLACPQFKEGPFYKSVSTLLSLIVAAEGLLHG